jgi:O-acetyl-ADP-ribose deacetylase (regulator of RNase III)
MRESGLAGERKLQIVHGDLTIENVDAIVNAANAFLIYGGGLAAMILLRGGDQIKLESEDCIQEHGQICHSQPAYTICLVASTECYR